MKILALALFLAMAVTASAYTRKGSSGKSIQSDGSQADTQRAIDAAPDDGTTTVILPNGTFTWSGTLRIEKAVSLAGLENTVIRNNLANGIMIAAKSGQHGNIQIYQLKFEQVADNSGGKGYTITTNRDTSTRYTVILHDCTFDQKTTYSYAMEAGENGVIIYNCEFIGDGGLGGVSFTMHINDYSLYNTPSTLGTKDPDGLHNSYLEDCTFKKAYLAGMNLDANSRTVIRHCAFYDCTIGSHGQETNPIGVIQWEIYNCAFHVSGPDNPANMQNYFGCRGGTGVITGCTLDEIPWKTQFQFNVYSITRGANDGHGASFCPIEYPAPRQTGWNWANNGANWGKVEDSQNPQLLEGGRSPGYFLPDGKGAILDPVYVWNNTGPGAKASTYVQTQTYQPDDCANGQVIDTYLKKGRELMVDQGPKPGWTPYPYPHPMRSGTGGGPQPTPTPQPTPNPTPTPPPPQPTPTPTPPPTGNDYSDWLNKLSDWIRQNPALPNR